MSRGLALLLGIVALVLASATVYLKPVLASALGLAARQACSLHVGAGIPLALARETYIDRHIRPLGPYVSTHVDANHVRASLFNLLTVRAFHREGYGCVLAHGEDVLALKPYRVTPRRQSTLNQPERQAHFDVSALDAAVEASFAEPGDAEPRQTMAVLVLSNGKLVAEKYAEGISQTTPLPGFSMAKSMTATMLGLLVLHKGLDVRAVVANAGKLSEAGVTYDQLLRMTSGIGVVEDGSGRDGNSIMLTQTHDAAAYAVNQALQHDPGTEYAYTGGNSVVLAKQFVELAGDGNPSEAYRFLADELLQPLAMTSVVLETDGVGTFLGSSFMLASALDWAKLGQLYLQNGVWEGRRVLPEGWTEYVSTKTPQSMERDYGAGFWVAVDGGRDSRHEHLPRPPANALFMHGMMNQAVYILPTESLVVVRLGATRSYLDSGEWELLADTLSAWKPAQTPMRYPEQ